MDISTKLPTRAEEGMVAELILAPDITGADENVLIPPIVCELDISTKLPTNAEVGMVEADIDDPDKTGAEENTLIPEMV